MTVIKFFSDAKKFLGALAGAAAVAISSGLISGTAERWTTTGIAVATAFVVYFLDNDSAKTPPLIGS